MHYFSLFPTKLLKAIVNFSRVWTKNTNCWDILKFFDKNSLEKLIFLSIFGKVVAKNRAFGNNNIFPHQSFQFRGRNIPCVPHWRRLWICLLFARRLPTWDLTGTHECYLAHSSQENEFWPPLVEKAYAKYILICNWTNFEKYSIMLIDTNVTDMKDHKEIRKGAEGRFSGFGEIRTGFRVIHLIRWMWWNHTFILPRVRQILAQLFWISNSLCLRIGS